MITAKKTTIDTDLHCHILPCVDDGAQSPQISLSMLEMLAGQGIRTVAATPHFDIANENVSDFISRRDASYESLGKYLDNRMPRIVLGAEVMLSRGIAENDLRPLCYGKSDIILVELPRLPYGNWIISELEVILYEQKLTPVIAHIDRYMEWYSEEDIFDLLSFEEAWFQVNNHAFNNKKAAKRVKEIVTAGYSVVLGSDAHDTGIRCPNFDLAENALCRMTFKRKVLPKIEAAQNSLKI